MNQIPKKQNQPKRDKITRHITEAQKSIKKTGHTSPIGSLWTTQTLINGPPVSCYVSTLPFRARPYKWITWFAANTSISFSWSGTVLELLLSNPDPKIPIFSSRIQGRGHFTIGIKWVIYRRIAGHGLAGRFRNFELVFSNWVKIPEWKWTMGGFFCYGGLWFWFMGRWG